MINSIALFIGWVWIAIYLIKFLDYLVFRFYHIADPQQSCDNCRWFSYKRRCYGCNSGHFGNEVYYPKIGYWCNIWEQRTFSKYTK